MLHNLVGSKNAFLCPEQKYPGSSGQMVFSIGFADKKQRQQSTTTKTTTTKKAKTKTRTAKKITRKTMMSQTMKITKTTTTTTMKSCHLSFLRLTLNYLTIMTL